MLARTLWPDRAFRERASGEDLNVVIISAVPILIIVFHSNYWSILFSFRDVTITSRDGQRTDGRRQSTQLAVGDRP